MSKCCFENFPSLKSSKTRVIIRSTLQLHYPTIYRVYQKK
jgi:hypothetical protein